MKVFPTVHPHRLSAALALLLALCMLLGACGSKPPEPSEDTVCLTDALGREVCVTKQPSRVAALLGSFADVWMLAGGSLCAAAEDAWEDFELNPEGAVNLGGAHSPSTERLLSASPELVLASASTTSHVDLMEPLEAMGIAVLYFDIDCFEDYLAMLKVCTELTDREDLYEQNGVEIGRQIDAVKARIAADDLPEDRRRVLLLRASSTSVKAKGSQGTILGEMLAELGCINLADSDTSLLRELSVEAVIRENPYRIFVVTMGNDTEAARASIETMMKENPAWGGLEAVRENRLHVMDKALFNLKPNDRWAEAYETLYETLTDQ